MNLVRSYHKAVIRPEMMGMVKQLEHSIKAVNDRVFNCARELQFMVSENRSSQKHASGLMIVTTGWPPELTPPQRHYMLAWMLSRCPAIVQYLKNRGLLSTAVEQADMATQPPELWFNVFTLDPVTVPAGQGYSGMTMLHFKGWDLRSEFLKQYGGQNGVPLYTSESTPLPNRHIRTAPCTPQWQRKLESPLRVLIAALNAHPDTHGKKIEDRDPLEVPHHHEADG